MIKIPPYQSYLPSTPLTLHVRKPEEEWQAVPCYFATSMSEQPHAFGGAEAFALLSHDEPLEVRLTVPEHIHKAIIRPSMLNPIAASTAGNEMIFKLDHPKYLVIEINHFSDKQGEIPHFTFYLLTDKPETIPDDAKVLTAGHHNIQEFDPGDCTNLVLAPGLHTVDESVPLFSDKTLFISSGAVLQAKIVGDQVSNANICGQGIIDGSTTPRKPGDWRSEGEQGFIFLRRGNNICIDGPVIYNCPYWNIVAMGTNELTIRNHKCLTWQVNNDGIQPRSCNNLLVEYCFLKCADDCIAVKTRQLGGMTSRNLTFRNLTLWNDIPDNAVEIGHTSQADLLEDVLFENIQVVHSDYAKKDNPAFNNYTVSINIIDHCTVKNVLYKNIYVEGHRSRDFRFRIGTSCYSTDDKRGQIDTITVDGYHVDSALTHSLIQGFDDKHIIRNITFKNITHNNGTSATNSDLNISKEYAENINLITFCFSQFSY